MNKESEKKWNADDFVKLLNEEIPLKNRGEGDHRRTEEWNVRLLRHYTTEKVLSKPLKEGRRSYYTYSHLEEVKSFIESQSMGISSKSYVRNVEKYQSNNETIGFAGNIAGSSMCLSNSVINSTIGENDLKGKKENIYSLLEQMNIENNSRKKEYVEISNKDYLWQHIKINDYLTIQIREDQLNKKEEIINLLKKLR